MCFPQLGYVTFRKFGLNSSFSIFSTDSRVAPSSRESINIVRGLATALTLIFFCVLSTFAYVEGCLFPPALP